MASDWLAAVLPANQMPSLKTSVNSHGNFLVTQAPGHVVTRRQCLHAYEHTFC